MMHPCVGNAATTQSGVIHNSSMNRSRVFSFVSRFVIITILSENKLISSSYSSIFKKVAK
jgi:hypothetical protein